MKKIMFSLIVGLMLIGTNGCVTIGDTASTNNTNSNNDNSVDNSTSGTSNNTNASDINITINGSTLTCSQAMNSTNIEAGTYSMSKLEYGSVVSVVEIPNSVEVNSVDFALVAADVGKSLSCGSEYRLTDGTTKTHRSETVVY